MSSGFPDVCVARMVTGLYYGNRTTPQSVDCRSSSFTYLIVSTLYPVWALMCSIWSLPGSTTVLGQALIFIFEQRAKLSIVANFCNNLARTICELNFTFVQLALGPPPPLWMPKSSDSQICFCSLYLSIQLSPTFVDFKGKLLKGLKQGSKVKQ